MYSPVDHPLHEEYSEEPFALTAVDRINHVVGRAVEPQLAKVWLPFLLHLAHNHADESVADYVRERLDPGLTSEAEVEAFRQRRLNEIQPQVFNGLAAINKAFEQGVIREMELAALAEQAEAKKAADEVTFRVLRERAQLSVYRMADLVGCDASSIRNWEYGRTVPSIPVEKFSALCSVLGVTIQELSAAYATSARLNASPEAPDPLVDGKRRRGRIR